MNIPTREQVLEAAETSIEARRALRKLFPEIFDDNTEVKIGEIYEWGTSSNGGSGLLVHHPTENAACFVNFISGDIYLPFVQKGMTRYELNERLKETLGKLHSCYQGEIRGPKRFKSWVTR